MIIINWFVTLGVFGVIINPLYGQKYVETGPSPLYAIVSTQYKAHVFFCYIVYSFPSLWTKPGVEKLECSAQSPDLTPTEHI